MCFESKLFLTPETLCELRMFVRFAVEIRERGEREREREREREERERGTRDELGAEFGGKFESADFQK